MKRKKGFCAVLLIGVTLLSGCMKPLPEMTAEQEDKIVEYAADAVMAYVDNQGSRLVDLTLYDEKKEQDDINEKEDSGKMDATDDTEIIDIGEGTESGSLDELLVPEGVTITYTGYRMTDSYPDDYNGNPYFALDASAGKKLLVLQFTLENTTGAVQEIDIFSHALTGTVTLNGKDKLTVLSTMLLDDMSTFVGSLGAGEKIALVLLTETEDATPETAEKLQLKIKTDVGNVTTTLK